MHRRLLAVEAAKECASELASSGRQRDAPRLRTLALDLEGRRGSRVKLKLKWLRQRFPLRFTFESMFVRIAQGTNRRPERLDTPAHPIAGCAAAAVAGCSRAIIREIGLLPLVQIAASEARGLKER